MTGGAVWNLHYASPVLYDPGNGRLSGPTAVGGVKR